MVKKTAIRTIRTTITMKMFNITLVKNSIFCGMSLSLTQGLSMHRAGLTHNAASHRSSRTISRMAARIWNTRSSNGPEATRRWTFYNIATCATVNACSLKHAAYYAYYGPIRATPTGAASSGALSWLCNWTNIDLRCGNISLAGIALVLMLQVWHATILRETNSRDELDRVG